jgi:hypothetical protein
MIITHVLYMAQAACENSVVVACELQYVPGTFKVRGFRDRSDSHGENVITRRPLDPCVIRIPSPVFRFFCGKFCLDFKFGESGYCRVVDS